MTREDVRSDIPAKPSRVSARAVLLGIVLAASVPLIYLAVTERIEYDGYWIAFIATQDRWRNFIAEYQANAHPPLYYLVLRAGLWFGRSLLAYRAVSILAGLGTIYLVGRAALKLTRSSWTAALAALAYGVAMPTLVVSIEVRGYMLCTFFALLSYRCFLSVIARDGPAGTLRPRIACAAAAALSCLTDYYSFFYVGAVLIVAMARACWWSGEPRSKALGREAVTFAAVLGVMAFLYFTHTAAMAIPWGHLQSFYYMGMGTGTGAATESVGEFLLRNLQNDFNLLSPWQTASQPVFVAILAGLLLAGAGSLWLLRRLKEPKNLPAAATVVVTALILAEIMLAGVLGKYPFGGFLRQQFLLFPFLVLSGFVLLDRLTAGIPRRTAWILAGVLAAAIGWVGYAKFAAYPKATERLMTDQMRQFNNLFPKAAAVYVDHYNFFAFFMHHDDWTWESEGQARWVPSVGVYRISRGNRQILVFRDSARWVLEYDDAALYDDLANCMRSEGLRAIDVFRAAQEEGPPREAREIREYGKTAASFAAEHGLCIERLAIWDWDAYAEIRAGGCDGAEAAGQAGGRAPGK
jgi:hypothetical protein